MNIPLFYKELNIPSAVEGLDDCLLLVKEIGENFNLDLDKLLSLQTVIVESVENAIIHGNNGIRELKVCFLIQVYTESIFIEVEDQGNGFDIDSVPSPILPENLRKECGRGIFFIRSLSSSCFTRGKGNILYIKIDR